MELSAQPDAGDGWQEDLARRFDEVDAMSYPTLARVMPLARDNAFMLRWSSGTVHPLDSSFAVLLDTLLHGLRARLTAR
jgi:TetR/AcrR family tetracycline transcriptional repressor